MSEKKEEIKEETKDNRTKHIVLVTVLIILLMGVAGTMGYALGGVHIINKVNGDPKEQTKKDTTKTKDKSKDKNEEDNIEKKLNKFVNAGILSRNIGLDKGGDQYGARSLIRGYDLPLTIYDKIKITLAQIVIVDKNYKEVDTIPDEMKSADAGNSQYSYYELSVEDFRKEYKSLFNEDVDFELSEIKNQYVGSQTCPYVAGVDSDKNTIYLMSYVNQCSRVWADMEVLYKTIKIENDDDYYYVHQYIGIHVFGSNVEAEGYFKSDYREKVEVDGFEGNEDKFSYVVWKFDKKGNFVSTTVNG